ncbi:MAG TPA: TetR/AcrR family transcriptional regulator [Longimicrobiales bacterium]|nr:TetR/AcrR family transcriptional regulator [Longimicrobiales bacterium]
MSTRDEWIKAAASAMAGGGVDAIRVEALARQLGITKGSFYWHFTDRNALLEAVLAQWEAGARQQLEAARTGAAADERMAAFFRDLARPANGVADTDIQAWARHDRLVAERVSMVERDRLVFLKEQLSEMGASLIDAHRRAEAGYLAVQAWLERAARTPWMKGDYVAFVNDVFRLLLRSQPSQPV